MDFGQSISSIEEFKGASKPEARGYVGVITKVVDGASKTSGKPMLTLHLDIVEGPNKGFFKGDLRDYYVYHDDKGKGKIKYIARVAKDENPGKISAADFSETTFNEQALVNCKIGLVLGYNENGFLNVRYLTSVEEALAASTIEAPDQTGADIGAVSGVGEDDLPF